jgi:hypothetical protein
MEAMTPGERKWAWVYGFTLAAVCTIPYLIGYAMEGTEWAFSGFVFGVEDGNSYLAKMLAGAYGDWFFRTPYTTLKQSGELIFLPYLLLGKLAQPPALHLQLVALFQLFRFVATPLTVFAIYRFSTLFLPSVSWRRWVTVLSTIGGGLGWTLPIFGRTEILGSLPLDFISPETFGFLAFLGLPHLILARGLMILALHAYLEDGRQRNGSWRSGSILLLLTLVQSLSTLSAYAVIFIHQLLVMLKGWRSGDGSWRGRWLPASLRSILPSIPLILYYIYRFSTEPFLQAWTDQNRILSPHPLHYLLAFGVVMIPVFAGFLNKPWIDQPIWLLPVGWVVALPILAYFPHNLQRRLVEGVWVVLLIFVAYFLQQWKRGPGYLRTIRISITIAIVISPIMLLIGSLQVASNPSSPAFLEADQARAFHWLEKNVARGSVVLAEFTTSNALPAWAPARVPLGHGPESIHFEEIKPQLASIYGNAINSSERLRWLTQFEVAYIFFGGKERTLGAWEPEQETYLLNVYQNDSVAIYEVEYAQD